MSPVSSRRLVWLGWALVCATGTGGCASCVPADPPDTVVILAPGQDPDAADAGPGPGSSGSSGGQQPAWSQEGNTTVVPPFGGESGEPMGPGPATGGSSGGGVVGSSSSTSPGGGSVGTPSAGGGSSGVMPGGSSQGCGGSSQATSRDPGSSSAPVVDGSSSGGGGGSAEPGSSGPTPASGSSGGGEVSSSESGGGSNGGSSSSGGVDGSGSSSGRTCIAAFVCPVGACGTVLGGCGDVYECGGCPWPQQCGATVPNVCGGAVTTVQFSEGGRTPVGYDPRGVALASVADGEWRAMTAQPSSQDLTLTVARGDGSLEVLSSTSLEQGPVAVLAVAADADPWLFVARHGGGGVMRSSQGWNGTGAAQELLATAPGPRHLAQGDLDGNGNVDVVVGHDSGAVVVVWDALTPSWWPQLVAQEYGRVGGLTVAEVLEDGVTRVIYTVPDLDLVVVLDASTHARVEWPTLYAPEAVAVVDANQDGHMDLLVAHPFYGQVAVMQQEAGAFAFTELFGDGNAPNAMLVLDVDGDGQQDLAYVDGGGHLHVRAPVMAPQHNLELFTGSAPVALATADLNRDGAPDLVVLNQVGGDLVSFLNVSF